MSRESELGRAERSYYATPDEIEDEDTEYVYDTDEDWRWDK
jgi:hypothetical protein